MINIEENILFFYFKNEYYVCSSIFLHLRLFRFKFNNIIFY